MKKHYQIHYVDNTKQQYRRLRMPILWIPIHTINQTIDYIKRIFTIEKRRLHTPVRKKQRVTDWNAYQKSIEMKRERQSLSNSRNQKTKQYAFPSFSAH